MAESIEEDCSDAVPCLVWLAWNLRSKDIKLKARPVPVLDARMTMPDFTVVYAGPVSAKLPREYLQNPAWVNAFKSVVKGVNAIDINEELMEKADNLASLLVPRLAYHIADRVDQTRRKHWTLGFTRDNLPPVAAAMCLVGHIVDDIESYGMDERLLVLPMHDIFQIISGNISSFEGCYLFFDKKKMKWI